MPRARPLALFTAVLLAWFGGLQLGAQSAVPGAQNAVPAAQEPHHHPSYTDSLVRVLRVEVPPHSTTLLHSHAVDYTWVAVGASEVINAVQGKPDATIKSADGSVHFTRGGFAHLARNEGSAPFFNVTIELLRAQEHPRNLCEAVLAGEPTDCPRATARAREQYSGAKAAPQFETDQVRVTLITLDPGTTLLIRPQTIAPLLVNIDDTDGEATARCELGGAAPRIALGSRSGDVTPLDAGAMCAIRNPGQGRLRVLALDFTAPHR